MDHQTGLCGTRGATEVKNKAKTVLIPSWVKNRTVEFGFVLSLSQPVEGQWRRRGLFCSKPQQGGTTRSCPGGSSSILIQQHLPIDVSTRRREEFNSHSSFTAAPVGIAVFHQQLVGENTGQVESSGALHILRHVRRAQRHSYEVLIGEGEGTRQLDGLGTEGFDGVPRAGSHLVDAVAPNLVVLHVTDLQKKSRVSAAGASLKVFICGDPHLEE